jgi:hypothetical protein
VTQHNDGARGLSGRAVKSFLVSSKPGYLRTSGHFEPAEQPLTPGGKDGTADRFRGHPVHFPADFSNMTSLGFFCTVPALSLDSELKGSLTSKHSRSTAGSQ